MALHLHDYNKNTIHRLPFDGKIDWSVAMKKIDESGYSGSTAIEAMNWDYKDLSAKEFLHKAFDRAKGLEALKLYNP